MEKIQYLLLQDVDGLGRSGDVVSNIKPGFLRNFLLPQGKVLRAGAHTVKKQQQLAEERKKQAKVDLEEARKMAEKFKGLVLEVEVEVNPEGEMYGSVSQVDIIRLLEKEGFAVERRFIRIPQAIKQLGEHTIPMRLKEDVEASFVLKVTAKNAPLQKEESEKK